MLVTQWHDCNGLESFYMTNSSRHSKLLSAQSSLRVLGASKRHAFPSPGLFVLRPFWFLRASAMLKHGIDIGWTSVRPSVTRWYCIKTAEHIVMLSSPHDSPFILVLCVLKIFAKFRRGHPLRGRQTEMGMIKPAIFQKHGASINRSIQRAINLVRRSTAINTLATTVRVSTVNSHFQSNEH